MELWIRRQDKMALTRNVGLRIIIEQEGASIIDETNDYILGMYNTEERALEVWEQRATLMRSLTDSDLKIIQYEIIKNYNCLSACWYYVPS